MKKMCRNLRVDGYAWEMSDDVGADGHNSVVHLGTLQHRLI